MKKTRKILSALLALIMTLSCFAVTSVSAEANESQVSVYDASKGYDTDLATDADGAILIQSANELMGFMQRTATDSFSGKTVKLTTNIVINVGDASTWTKDSTGLVTWVCSNAWDYAFDGIFDGQGHYISGLYAPDTVANDKNNGFFSFVNPTASDRGIKNLSIVNSYFYAPNDNSGALVGAIQGRDTDAAFTIDNVSVQATVVSDGGYAGGFVGKAFDNNLILNITNSRFDGSVSAKGDRVGGLVGSSEDSVNITYCSVGESVSGTGSYYGGIIGYCSGDAVFNIKRCNVGGTVSGAKRVGGIIGHTSEAKVVDNATIPSYITDCKVNATIRVSGERAGGLIGEIHNDSNVVCSKCDVTADIVYTAATNQWGTKTGLLIGIIQNNGDACNIGNSLSISDCIAKGEIVDDKLKSAGCVGYVMSGVSGKSISITIDNVLLAISEGSVIPSVTVNYWESNSSLAFNFSDIKYNFGNVDNSSTYGGAYKGQSGVTPGGTAESATWVASDSLNGVEVFDGWTAVEGKYPTPIKPTAIFGYQHTYDYDVTENSGETYRIRLLATVSGNEYVAAGFKDVSLTYMNSNGQEIGKFDLPVYYCEYLYSSVTGGGETYTANAFLCDNIFCLAMGNISKDVASIVVSATPLVAKDAMNVTVGEEITFTANIH